MGILDILKINLGATYNKSLHRYETNKIKEGESIRLENGDILINEKGSIQMCKEIREGKWRCKRLPVKVRKEDY